MCDVIWKERRQDGMHAKLPSLVNGTQPSRPDESTAPANSINGTDCEVVRAIGARGSRICGLQPCYAAPQDIAPEQSNGASVGLLQCGVGEDGGPLFVVGQVGPNRHGGITGPTAAAKGTLLCAELYIWHPSGASREGGNEEAVEEAANRAADTFSQTVCAAQALEARSLPPPNLDRSDVPAAANMPSGEISPQPPQVGEGVPQSHEVETLPSKVSAGSVAQPQPSGWKNRSPLGLSRIRPLSASGG